LIDFIHDYIELAHWFIYSCILFFNLFTFSNVFYLHLISLYWSF